MSVEVCFKTVLPRACLRQARLRCVSPLTGRLRPFRSACLGQVGLNTDGSLKTLVPKHGAYGTVLKARILKPPWLWVGGEKLNK